MNAESKNNKLKYVQWAYVFKHDFHIWYTNLWPRYIANTVYKHSYRSNSIAAHPYPSGQIYTEPQYSSMAIEAMT